ITEQPSVTANRYVNHPAPGALLVTLTGPAPNSTVESNTTTVTGATAPGAHVVVESTDIDTGATASTASTTAGADGSFSVPVPIGFGTDVLTATAATQGATGYAQVSVVGDIVGGTTVLDVTDPTGDDNGPGTYQYPTSSNFTPGSFDITRFQVITLGSTVYLRTTLRTLVPTFGNVMGAQLLDIYLHTPTAAATSTAAAFPSRNYTLADPWSQRLEVQGFAAPVWVDANGNSLGTPAVVASTVANTITIALPAAALGTPTTGWTFAEVLTGQDGFSADQARSFAPTAQPFQFGVCATGNLSPICSVDPTIVPKAMDVLAPSGVSQSAELDPTAGPVVIHAVPVS
ncbi:MAG TPA: glucodextranase DOMON-like domain-containing protein, partial [Pseudonocardiaceae bacterium]|nr:glucodextranase DOMON-like domain-containing protein [Pseudonocardiaceae bacterium]